MIYINGKYFAESEAKISIKDRGLRFGDGVFETIKFVDNKLEHFEKHLNRLNDGLQAIKINFDSNNLEKIIYELIAKNGLNSGIARIMITRGEGSRGYLPTYQTPPSVIIETMPLREMDLTNIKLCVSPYKKIPLECLPVNYKLMQGMNYALAKQEAKEQGFFDTIMLTTDGFISECTSSNIFFEKDGKIYTPSLDCACLRGVMREVIIEENKGKIIEGKFTLNELKTADKIFITNSIIGKVEVNDISFH